MAYKSLTSQITSVSPLLMHNGVLADPLSPQAKALAEITGKRKKTEADHMEMAKREFFGGLYLQNGRPIIPAEMMEASLAKAAASERKKGAAIAGILVEKALVIDYDGPKTKEELWEDERFRLRTAVKVTTSKVMRTRPKFDQWSAEVTILFNPDLLNERDVQAFLIKSGQEIGLGDWRPRYGRFNVG